MRIIFPVPLIFIFLLSGCSLLNYPRTQVEPQQEKDMTIYYSQDSDTIRAMYYPMVDSIGQIIQDDKDLILFVVGIAHPEEAGYNDEKNLATRRSRGVIKYIEARYEIENTRILLGEEVIGPALGSKKKFIPPPKKEYRKVKLIVEPV